MADVKSGVMRILCQLSCPTCHAGTSSITGARDQIILGGLRKEGPHRGGLLRRAWRSLLFEDEELDRDRLERDPVAPAQPSASVRRKKSTHQTATGLPVHSFRTLLAHLGGRKRETYQVVSDPSGSTFDWLSELDPVQAEALRLLEM